MEFNEITNAPINEAYKALRTNLQFCGFIKKFKTLAVVSANPGEGKTTTVTNLAVVTAKSGIKVLVINADLRKASYAKGLSNYISGFADLKEIIIPSKIENLSYIDSGSKPPNPTELLNSKIFSDLVSELKVVYDIIIIDTPALGSVIDGAIVASITEGTLIVTSPNKVSFSEFERLKTQLGKAKANIIGVTMNNIPKDEYRKYYNRYYDMIEL
ncbi:MAG TPA: CpsD/CapB family tyrosine-protein kinase [Pseudobacteroides sp.]|nr:CpsD/CapB family tyrosine-protein kinase [Pseudobacteroides sp.]